MLKLLVHVVTTVTGTHERTHGSTFDTAQQRAFAYTLDHQSHFSECYFGNLLLHEHGGNMALMLRGAANSVEPIARNGRKYKLGYTAESVISQRADVGDPLVNRAEFDV
jgi:hypothetical protein